MGFFDKMSNLRLPNVNKLVNIPSEVKTNAKKTDINTVDVIFFNNDWDYCVLTTGIKRRITNIPQIDLKIPENLSFFTEKDSSSYNKSNQRELYLVNEKSPFVINLSNIKLKSCNINIDDNNNEIMETELTQKLLNTLGTVRLIDDINEKNTDGAPIIFIMGCFVGGIIMSIILAYLYSS